VEVPVTATAKAGHGVVIEAIRAILVTYVAKIFIVIAEALSKLPVTILNPLNALASPTGMS
jgi:hypothetical protein